jgi:hypothetical protein
VISYEKVMYLAEQEYARLKGEDVSDWARRPHRALPSEQIHALAHALCECIQDELDDLGDRLERYVDALVEDDA